MQQGLFPSKEWSASSIRNADWFEKSIVLGSQELTIEAQAIYLAGTPTLNLRMIILGLPAGVTKLMINISSDILCNHCFHWEHKERKKKKYNIQDPDG